MVGGWGIRNARGWVSCSVYGLLSTIACVGMTLLQCWSSSGVVVVYALAHTTAYTTSRWSTLKYAAGVAVLLALTHVPT